MIDRLRYEIEINGSAATLYLAGGMDAADLPFLRVLCAAIPTFVRMLRVDILALRPPAPVATGGLQEILQAWRAQRRGNFTLSLRIPHMVATLHGDADDATPTSFSSASLNPEALMATYL